MTKKIAGCNDTLKVLEDAKKIYKEDRKLLIENNEYAKREKDRAASYAKNEKIKLNAKKEAERKARMEKARKRKISTERAKSYAQNEMARLRSTNNKSK